MKLWGFSEKQFAKVIGYSLSDGKSIEDIINHISHELSLTTEQRLHYLSDIKIGLDSLFGEEDLEAQIGWLNTPKNKFGGQTPRQLLRQADDASLIILSRYWEDRVA